MKRQKNNYKQSQADRREMNNKQWNPLDDDNNADNFELYPTNPEEFGVLAFRLSRERNLRRVFTSTLSPSFIGADHADGPLMEMAKNSKRSHGAQLLEFFRNLRDSYS